MSPSNPINEPVNHVAIVLQLLETHSNEKISNYLDSLHPVELESLITQLDPEVQRDVAKHITGLDQVAAVLSHADRGLKELFVSLLDDARLSAAVRRMEIDDAADLVGMLPRRKQANILNRLSPRLAKDLGTLLAYNEETAGGLMTPLFAHAASRITAGEAISMISLGLRHGDIDPDTNINYVYLLDDKQRIEGTCSLRELLSASPDTPASEIMETAVISVNPSDDQEKVAQLIKDYDLSCIPVVEKETEKMLGIVTVDDIIDVLEEEHAEDLLKLAGTEDQDIVSATVGVSLRSRLPWLLASWIGGVAGAMLLGNFSETLQRAVALASFMPVVFGMGGNVGSQSATITVHGLAIGHLGEHNFYRRFQKELVTGMSLGMFFGMLLGVASFLIYGERQLSFVVGTSIFITMSCAAVLGSSLPILFKKLGIDPTVASGPLVTTSTDLISICIYFTVASILL